MRTDKRFLITVVVTVLIIALIGAAAAITVSVVGKGTSYAFWSESYDVSSTETSDTTALAKEINPSEKYIEYEYYVIDGGEWNPKAVWTRKEAGEEKTDDGDGVMRPQFAQDADITTTETDGETATNLKAVVKRYTGNISTLNVPDTTPVWVGGVLCKAEVVEIASLNMETSPGVAVVDKLIIGRNVKAIGYSRGSNGGIISSGMYGFYALNEILVVRDGKGTEHANGYYTDFDKITAVGHFFEDSPSVKALNVLLYSSKLNAETDAVPLKRSVGDITEVFKGQSDAETPDNFVYTGIENTHGTNSGFKLSVTAIADSHGEGVTVYKDLLHTEVAGSVKYDDSGYYNVTIEGNSYRLRRAGNSGLIYLNSDPDNAVGRYDYGAYTITLTLYKIENGEIAVDELGIPKTEAKYFY